MQSGRLSTGTEPERGVHNNYAQVFQDFLNSELKSQIAQFRTEMLQAMNESLKDFNDKSNKNQETIVAIKESIKNHSHNIEKLDHKIEEYHSNLDTISGMFQSEIEKIKYSSPAARNFTSQDSKQLEESLKAYNEDKLIQIENQQQEIAINFERLREELTENVRISLEDYSRNSEHENTTRTQRISTEIANNMEQKIDKVLDHLDGKVTVLEKQIENYNKPDESLAEKLRFEIDDKINEQAQGIRQQILVLHEQIQAKTDEPNLKEHASGLKIYIYINNIN